MTHSEMAILDALGVMGHTPDCAEKMLHHSALCSCGLMSHSHGVGAAVKNLGQKAAKRSARFTLSLPAKANLAYGTGVLTGVILWEMGYMICCIGRAVWAGG